MGLGCLAAMLNLSKDEGRQIVETVDSCWDKDGCRVAEIISDQPVPVRRFVVSTPETRAICNDPFLVGVAYTDALRVACERTITFLDAKADFPLLESNTTVLHILRGGLNFGLREAFQRTLGWNRHFSAFISAQRARNKGSLEDWHITEGSYRKVYLAPKANIVFGDVVATGTSLEFALHELLDIVAEEGVEVSSVVFFTIGGQRAEEILISVDATCRHHFANYLGATVIYFEGRFGVATHHTPLAIKVPGTDLLRREALLADDFIESQYADQAYPLERCAIYDAGSRAFWLPEYIEDVWDYWEQTLWLAKSGVTYSELLRERAPMLDISRFGEHDLCALCERQLARCEELISDIALRKPAFKKE